MSDPVILSGDAKNAIFKYLMTITIPSAGVLSILAGIAGFELKSIGVDEGYSAAYAQGAQEIIRTAEAASVGKGQIDALLEVVKKSRDDAATASAAAAQSKVQLDAITSQKINEIASALGNNGDFQKALVGINQKELDSVAKMVSELKLRSDGLLLWPKDNYVSNSGGSAACPDGSYMTSISFAAEPGLDHGALYAAQITCRKLNAASF